MLKPRNVYPLQNYFNIFRAPLPWRSHFLHNWDFQFRKNIPLRRMRKNIYVYRYKSLTSTILITLITTKYVKAWEKSKHIIFWKRFVFTFIRRRYTSSKKNEMRVKRNPPLSPPHPKKEEISWNFSPLSYLKWTFVDDEACFENAFENKKVYKVGEEGRREKDFSTK